MGTLDDHIQMSATPLLRPGEQITARAHARIKPRSFGSTGDTYKEWLVAATNQRLMFFPAKQTLTMSIAPGGGGEPFFVELRDLSAVGLQTNIGLSDYRRMMLVPIPGRGPRALDGKLIGSRTDLGNIGDYEHKVIIDLTSSTSGVDEQQRFHATYPDWIAQQVTTRAFWGPEEYAAEQAARVAAAEKERLEAERKRQAAEKRAQLAAAGLGAAKRALPFVGPAMLALVAIGLAITGVVLVVDAVDRAGRFERAIELQRSKIKLLEVDIAWRRAGKDPPTDCPDEQRYGASLRECHGCTVYSKNPPTTPSGHKEVRRGNKLWMCPPLGEYTEKLAAARGRVKEFQQDDRTGQLVGGIAAGVGGLLMLAGAVVWLLLMLRKRKRAQQQAAAPPAPAAA